MSDTKETIDWLAVVAAMILLVAMVGFATQGNHTKDKAWNSMIDQLDLKPDRDVED